MPKARRSRNDRSTQGKAFIVIATVAVTLAVTVILRNVAGGEKEIHRTIPRLYSTHDPNFLRAMGIALGPSILAGCRVTSLQRRRSLPGDL